MNHCKERGGGYEEWERGRKRGTMIYCAEIHKGSHTILKTISTTGS